MKNLFKSLVLVAVAAMAFTACQKDVNEVNAIKENVVLTFTAGFDETRANFGEFDGEVYPIEFAADDWSRIVVDFYDGSSYGNGWNVAVEEANFELLSKSAITFSVEAPQLWTKDDDIEYVYARYGAAGQSFVGGYEAYASINGVQKPTATSVDPDFIAMVAEFPVSYNDAVGQYEYAVEGTFQHVAAYAKMTLPVVEGVKFETVKVKMSYRAHDEYGGSWDVEESYTLDVTAVEGNDYWFACKPMEVEKFAVEAVSTDGVVYEYATEVEAAEGETAALLSLKAGVATSFSVKELEAYIPDYFMTASCEDAYYYGSDWSVVDYTAVTIYVWDANNPDLNVNDSWTASAVFTVGYSDTTLVSLPEGVIDLTATSGEFVDGLDYFFPEWNSYAMNPYASFTSVGLSVEYLEEGYSIVLSYETSEGARGSYSYSGIVDGIYNPGGDPLPLEEPWIFGYDVDGCDIEIGWAGSDNANSYEVYYAVVGSEEKTLYGTVAASEGIDDGWGGFYYEYLLEGLEYETEYNVYVRALPAADTIYGPSEFAYETITTGLAPEPAKLYLNPADWANDISGSSPWFAAYFWGNAGSTWVEMTAVEGDAATYEVLLPEGEYANVIFTRMKPGTTDLDWSSVNDNNNQTVDLVIPTDDKNYFVITTAWDSNQGWKATGEWSVYTPGQGGENPEPEPEPEPEVLEIVSASAVPAGSSYIGGTGYDVTFVGANGETIVYQVQTKDHTYLREGDWNGDFGWSDEGYINNVSWTGVGYPWPYTMTVAVVDDNYDILLEVNDYNDNFKYYSARFVGQIEGFTLPVEEEDGDDSGDEDDGDDTPATEITIYGHATAYTGGNEHELLFKLDESGSSFANIDFLANPIVAGTYTLKNGLSGMYCKYKGISMSSCKVVVTDNGDSLTFDATFECDGVKYHFTYTAQIYS